MNPDRPTIALDLAARELSVIPIEPRGKVPSIAWKGHQTRADTPDQIRERFRRCPDMNIGIVTGAAWGIVVVDVDSEAGRPWAIRRLTYTPWQTRTGRGWHFWYRHPGDGPIRNRARIDVGNPDVKIDIRADGGFVVAPGSIHESGAVYSFAGDWSVPKSQLPVFWRGWLERSKPTRQICSSPTSLHRRPTGDVVERARRYLAAIPQPEIGQGSDTAVLSAACRLVRGFELAPADAEALLWEWAGNRPGWTREWITAKVRNAERYGTEAIGALR